MKNSLFCRWLAGSWRIWALGAGSLTILTGCMSSMPPTAGYGREAKVFSVNETSASRMSAPVESRPGLGTGWGEHRDSRVTSTQFVRATSSPSARTSIYYNDREGIDAMILRYGSRSVRSFDVGGIATVEIRPGGRWRAAPGYNFNGKNYVVGEDGERYSIKVTNRTSGRIEVILSVDGLDVLDGRSASTGKPGYAVAPRSSVTVDGWRKSMSGVAAFRFGSVSDSYASRSGAGTRNVGVIGAAVFQEKYTGPVYYPHPRLYGGSGSESHRRHQADPFPAEGRFASPPR